LVFADLDAGLLFAGDHVLPTISPSIGYEPVRADLPLADFMASLHVVLQLPDLLVLPAHGLPGASSRRRAAELLDFHVQRLEQTLDVVQRTDGLSAMQVAMQLAWTRRARSFDELDVRNRLLAVAETAAHLDVLARDGAIIASTELDARSYRGRRCRLADQVVAVSHDVVQVSPPARSPVRASVGSVIPWEAWATWPRARSS
jgi:hypothetical protein